MVSNQIEIKNEVLFVKGELTFATTHSLAKSAKSIFKKLPKLNLDLSQVTESDNSALALLLSWLRDAEKSAKEISFTNLPKQLQDLAKLSGLISYLPINK